MTLKSFTWDEHIEHHTRMMEFDEQCQFCIFERDTEGSPPVR